MKENRGINDKAGPVAPALPERQETEPAQAPQEQSWQYACSAAWELCDRRGIICDVRGAEKNKLDKRNKP
ncbi:MAG: hypothetical protein AAGU32_21540 [Bacillota bacterium]